MSITTADAAPTTLPSTVAPQPITPAPQTEISPVAGIAVLGWLIVGILMAKWLGVFRKRSVIGPQRLDADESAWMPFTIFVGAFFAASVAGAVVDRFIHTGPQVRLLFLNAVVETLAIGLFILVTIVARANGLALLGVQPHKILRGMLVGAICLFILFPMVIATELLTEKFIQLTHLPQPKPHQVLEDLTTSDNKHLIILAVVTAVVLAPIFEELAFRGVLQTALGRFFAWINARRNRSAEIQLTPSTVSIIESGSGPILSYESVPPPPPLTATAGARWLAIIITAAAFAAVHGEPAFVPPLMVLAIGLGYAYERTGNLWVTITMHALFNTCQIAIYLRWGQ
jgi:membrane protease YdiL (CAAX protease family)